MMRWLALEGALGPFGAAAGSADGSFPERIATTAGNDGLERGLAALAQVLDGARIADFDAIAVGTGPGGFTGLRIALSYAKSLALAARRPLVGVSSYDILEPDDAPEVRATFVHGRAGIASVRVRTLAGERFASGSYDDLAAFVLATVGTPRDLACYGAAEGTLAALGERATSVRHISSGIEPPVLALLRSAFTRNAAGRDESAHAVTADYGEPGYHMRLTGGA